MSLSVALSPKQLLRLVAQNGHPSEVNIDFQKRPLCMGMQEKQLSIFIAAHGAAKYCLLFTDCMMSRIAALYHYVTTPSPSPTMGSMRAMYLDPCVHL